MLATVLSLVAALSLALPGQTAVDQVGQELRSDPVYVDPAAEEVLTSAEQDRLRAAIGDAETTIYVAVLPASSSPESVLRGIANSAGLSGTYVLVTPETFIVTSDVVPQAADIAGTALQQNRDRGKLAVLEAFVGKVSAVAAGGASSGGGSGAPSGDAGGSDGDGSLMPLLLLGGGGAALYAWSRGRRRSQHRVDQRQTQAEFDADVQMLRAELSVLADDVMRLEPEVVTHPDARPDYEAATQRFRAASAALDYADEPVDLVRVERVVREAEYAMSRAQAIIRGLEPPAPPTELQQPGRHDEPALDVDQYGRPVYVGAGPFYGGGGWFGGGGSGLFSGLLIGSMLGGMGPFGLGGWGGGGIHGGGGSDGGFGGGGFGGGDWGGGDIGGGDW